MVALLDVNVLVALFDPSHLNHEDAHAWFAKNRKHGFATCPTTLNGCVRVLSNPAYPSVDATPHEVAARLRVLCSGKDHHFWSDSLSILDERAFQTRMIAGHQKITDAYLLGLAVHYKGKLATFDRHIPLKAVCGAGAHHIDLIG